MYIWIRVWISEPPSPPKTVQSRELEDKLNSIKKTAQFFEEGTEEAAALLAIVADQDGFLSRDQFTLLEEIGSGAFGTVHKGVVFNGQQASMCAVKVYGI